MNIKILSRNSHLYSTQRLIEAAKKRGHNVEVMDPLKCDLVIEKKKPSIFYRGKVITDTDAVIPRIGASVTFYGTAVVRQFEMMGVFTTTESQALVRSRDVGGLYSMAAALDRLLSDDDQRQRLAAAAVQRRSKIEQDFARTFRRAAHQRLEDADAALRGLHEDLGIRKAGQEGQPERAEKLLERLVDGGGAPHAIGAERMGARPARRHPLVVAARGACLQRGGVAERGDRLLQLRLVVVRRIEAVTGPEAARLRAVTG